MRTITKTTTIKIDYKQIEDTNLYAWYREEQTGCKLPTASEGICPKKYLKRLKDLDYEDAKKHPYYLVHNSFLEDILEFGLVHIIYEAKCDNDYITYDPYTTLNSPEANEYLGIKADFSNHIVFDLKGNALPNKFTVEAWTRRYDLDKVIKKLSKNNNITLRLEDTPYYNREICGSKNLYIDIAEPDIKKFNKFVTRGYIPRQIYDNPGLKEYLGIDEYEREEYSY